MNNNKVIVDNIRKILLKVNNNININDCNNNNNKIIIDLLNKINNIDIYSNEFYYYINDILFGLIYFLHNNNYNIYYFINNLD